MSPSDTAVPIGSWSIISVTWDAAADEGVYYINGTGRGIISYAGNPAAGTNKVRVGTEGDADTYASALQFAEILAFSSVLSGADLQKVEGYLAAKFGLQSVLPAGHTYKAVAP